ncbi:MAG: peptidoglycan DL-endopeptidase LytE [Blastocatellia bacterium]|nr:peptidoglycan DL-endopeptidase LytE [Blastocatellia bacterium]
MNTRILFPRLLVVCFALCITASVTAQSSESDSRQTRTSQDLNGTRLETDISAPPTVEARRSRIVGSAARVPATTSVPLLAVRFDRNLLTAIESHLGLPYHYAGTGPDSFDCSGFVWRTFQEAGFDFSRGPATSYWATFAAPSTEDRYKFGTLVFFSGLAHVGIVADEHGFYHASRHHGVIYSPFNEYWLSRVDGFRRVPIDSMPIPAAKAKPRADKSANSISAVVEDNQR